MFRLSDSLRIVVTPTRSTDCMRSLACTASRWILSTTEPSTVWRQNRGESSSGWGPSGPTAPSTTNSPRLFLWRLRWRTGPGRRRWTCWTSRTSRGGRASPPVWLVNWSRWVPPRPTLTIPVRSVAETGHTESQYPLHQNITIFKLTYSHWTDTRAKRVLFIDN